MNIDHYEPHDWDDREHESPAAPDPAFLHPYDPDAERRAEPRRSRQDGSVEASLRTERDRVIEKAAEAVVAEMETVVAEVVAQVSAYSFSRLEIRFAAAATDPHTAIGRIRVLLDFKKFLGVLPDA